MPLVRFGIVILPDLRWKESQRRWRRAEEYGFDHAWTYDHLGWRDLVDGPWFDAVPTLTAAATVTSRISLGTLVASPNFRHPVSFARQLTALDDISGGRLALGLGAGAGSSSFDTTVLGIPALTPRERVDRFTEFADLLDLLLRSDRVSWRGTYYQAVDARNAPGCVQQPRVPFVVAANGRRSMRIAARLGQGWVTSGTRTDDLDTWWRAVADCAAQFDDTLASAGRAPAELRRYLSLDAAPVFSLSSAEFFADAAGRAAELGFTDAIIHWPRPSGSYAGQESVLEAVAAGQLALREDGGAYPRPGRLPDGRPGSEVRCGKLGHPSSTAWLPLCCRCLRSRFPPMLFRAPRPGWGWGAGWILRRNTARSATVHVVVVSR
jgi:alkanesulfonate monooxygenase SsuD/methylene tetrahydromethanopterin reductase-like flavin-dependent oxidoreductase (luciferase family)